jgi:hypothetical protein
MTDALSRRTVRAVAIGGVVVAAAVVEYAGTGRLTEAGEALIAAAIAVAVAARAMTLPAVTARGAVIGGVFVLAGILTWSYQNRPIVIWGVLAAGGMVFAAWGRPWLVHLKALPRLGGAWLGIAYWPLGVVGAVLVGHLTVAAQRTAYAGVFTLAALAVVAAVRRRSSGGPGAGGDPSVGIAAAILMAIAILLLVGSGSLFDAVHAVPDNASAQVMRDRFWGGLGLFYHPNSMAGLAVVAALRIGPDRAFAAWQRLAVTGVAGLVLVLSNSRTGFVFAVSAALLHALLVIHWRPPGLPEYRRRPGLPDYRRRSGLPDYRRPWLAAGTPFVVLALVLVFSGGGGFLMRNRFGDDSDVTSGRVDTWKQVVTDWQHAGLAEKAFGDASTSRAVVIRANDGAPPQGPRRKLNTDNAAVGAFRRGGVLGAVAFLIGLGLLLWHALRGRADGTPPAAWFTLAAISAVPTIATEDWLLGGTNGAIWILLLAGEAYRAGQQPGVVRSPRTPPGWALRPDARSGASREPG